MKPAPNLAVALVGINAPGYRSLALDYLKAAVDADPRLNGLATLRLDLDTSIDPWWIAYRLLALKPAPDVVAFSVLCWNARRVAEVTRILKRALPDITVVVGGPEVAPIAEDVLAAHPEFDFVVRGEGEFAFADLLHSIARGGEAATTPGVTGRDANGGIVAGSDRDPISDLDSVASPYANAIIDTDGSAYIETYRGCPHACAYCYEGKGSTRVRSFSWERIAADIERVASVPGQTAFSFIDPVFNLTPDRLGRMADLLEPYARKGIRLHTIEVDIERIDAEQAAQLKRAGVVSVETGPQTVGSAALATCARTFDRDRFAAGVEACKVAGISVECDLIVGLPGDTAQDIVDGIDFAIGLDPGIVQLSTLHVLPGTRLWDNADELGLLFDPQPPHEPIGTRDLHYTELRRLEALGKAAAAVYRARR